MSAKKYYWIKLKSNFFDLDTIDWLLSQKNGCEYVVLYQKLCLLTANRNGEMSTEIGEMIIPYNAEKIARDTKFSFDTVVVALDLFKRIGLIYEQENGVLKIPYVEEVVGSETEYAKKKREYRKRIESGQNLIESKTMSSKTETMSETMSETISDKSIEIDIRDRDRDRDIEKEKEKEKDATALQSDNVKKKSKAKSFKNDYSIFEEFAGDNNSLLEALIDFSEMRKSIKKPMTDRAMKKLLTDLKKISEESVVQIQVLEQSIFNNWQGVYPLKNNERGFDNGRSENGNGETGGQNGSNFNFGVYL